MNIFTHQRLAAVGQLRDLLAGLDYNAEPFLYHLPDLLSLPEMSRINADHAVKFAELALKHDKLPIVADALKILNRMVDPQDGHLLNPGPDFFYDNRTFFWDALGSHIQAPDVISHIFNQTVFTTSLGQK
jgi:hypothetical protein